MFRRELRYASLLLGLLEVVWSISALVPNQSLLYYVVSEGHDPQSWFVAQLLTGMLLLYGAIFPCRPALHIGLFLTAIGWFSILPSFLPDISLAPAIISMPIFGVMSLLVLIEDIRGKNDGRR